MKIAIEKPEAGDVLQLLAYHVGEARTVTPPEFSFALPVDALLADGITFWTARDGVDLLGFAALKDLGDGTGEVKSMRTAPAHLRKGVAVKILEAIIREARRRAYATLFLETGVTDIYLPARKLYEKHGFSQGPVFGDYKPSDHNYFMKLSL